MKKTFKKVLAGVVALSIAFTIFGVSRIVVGEDVIGKVPIGDTGSASESKTSTTEEFTGLPIHLYLNGDANEDGDVTSDDAIYMLMHLYFPDDYPTSSDHILDVNKDGKINVDDAIRILMAVNFPEEYSLNPEPEEFSTIEDETLW